MPKLTIDNCKAPEWSEFAKLKRIKADAVFEEARSIKAEIRELEEKLSKVAARARAKIETAGLDESIKSIRYEDLLITRRDAHTRRSLDTKWAKLKLATLGVSKEEVDKHTRESEIEAGITFRRLGDDDGGDES